MLTFCSINYRHMSLFPWKLYYEVVKLEVVEFFLCKENSTDVPCLYIAKHQNEHLSDAPSSSPAPFNNTNLVSFEKTVLCDFS